MFDLIAKIRTSKMKLMLSSLRWFCNPYLMSYSLIQEDFEKAKSELIELKKELYLLERLKTDCLKENEKLREEMSQLEDEHRIKVRYYRDPPIIIRKIILQFFSRY